MKESTSKGGQESGMMICIPTPRIDWFPEAVRPFAKLGMKLQSDYMELLGHRVRAWTDWPATVYTCKSAEDLTSAQGEYMKTLQDDYAHFMDGWLQDTLMEQDDYDEDSTPAGRPDVDRLQLNRKAA